MTDAPIPQDHRAPLRILLVEDSDFLRQIFRAAYHSEHLIETASGAKDGWKAFVEKAPDIVFLDIILPDGNGHDLAFKMKEHSPNVFIVMATANDFEDDRREAALNRVDGFVAKPFNKQQINEILERCRVRRHKG